MSRSSDNHLAGDMMPVAGQSLGSRDLHERSLLMGAPEVNIRGGIVKKAGKDETVR